MGRKCWAFFSLGALYLQALALQGVYGVSKDKGAAIGHWTQVVKPGMANFNHLSSAGSNAPSFACTDTRYASDNAAVCPILID